MNTVWKRAVDRVNALDESRQEELGELILAATDAAASEPPAEQVRAMLAEADADMEAGRFQLDSDDYWRERLERLAPPATRT